MKRSILPKFVFAAFIVGSLVFSGTAARAQNPTPVPIFPPPGFVIPPSDSACILPGNKLDLQCFIANDRMRREFAWKRRHCSRKP